MNSPYRFLNRFNAKVLPIISPFVAGYVLGYMISDSDAHNKFQKYKPVHIQQVPFHNFYLYTRSDEDYKKCVDELETFRPKADQPQT